MLIVDVADYPRWYKFKHGPLAYVVYSPTEVWHLSSGFDGVSLPLNRSSIFADEATLVAYLGHGPSNHGERVPLTPEQHERLRTGRGILVERNTECF